MSDFFIFIFQLSLLKGIICTYGVPIFKVVFNVGYLSPFITIGKFISVLKESVSTIPDIISNLSSLLFKGGVKIQE